MTVSLIGLCLLLLLGGRESNRGVLPGKGLLPSLSQDAAEGQESNRARRNCSPEVSIVKLERNVREQLAKATGLVPSLLDPKGIKPPFSCKVDVDCERARVLNNKLSLGGAESAVECERGFVVGS